MSDSFSSYTGRSLDELKMLSASVETPRIHSMQASFQEVAHHIDDVINHLRSLQKDLPHWWRGGASDAAMGAFEKVVSHAQTTQQMAAGASEALKICAQVVGEQQMAMNNVPDLTVPTDAEERPFAGRVATATATGIARESAYEGARTRAASLVQGVAAQFVETQAKLSSLTGNIADTFQPIKHTSAENEISNPPLAVTKAPPRSAPVVPRPEPSTAQAATMTPVRGGMSEPPIMAEDVAVFSPAYMSGLESPHLSFSANPLVLDDFPLTSTIDFTSSRRKISSGTDHLSAARTASRRSATPPTKTTTRTNLSDVTGYHHSGSDHSAGIGRQSNSLVGPHNPMEPQHRARDNSDMKTSEASGRPMTSRPSIGESDMFHTDEPMMGPLGTGAASVSHHADEHSKRPAYLKERNLRLQSKPLAPPGGLLDADWASNQ